ncbi:MAG: superoxide dismutase [Ni] [Verrucomicrobiales bacterium]
MPSPQPARPLGRDQRIPRRQHPARRPTILAQRIKAPADDAGEAYYVAHLKATHTIIVAAMKCKQTVDAANAAALKKAIEDYKAIYFKK